MRNIYQGSARQIKAGQGSSWRRGKQGVEWRGGLQWVAVSLGCLNANDHLDVPWCIAPYFALLVEEEL